MKHLLFWTYFVIAAYLVLPLSTKPTSESLLKAAQQECKNVKTLDMEQMYCMAAYVEAQCRTGLDLRLCGETSRR